MLRTETPPLFLGGAHYESSINMKGGTRWTMTSVKIHERYVALVFNTEKQRAAMDGIYPDGICELS